MILSLPAGVHLCSTCKVTEADDYLVRHGIKPFPHLTFQAPDLTRSFRRRRQGFGTALQDPAPTGSHNGKLLGQIKSTSSPASCLQQTAGDTQTEQPCNISTNNVLPLQCSAQGAHEPEVVPLHLVNLDHFTKSLNSILKPDDGAVVAGTPRITLQAPTA